MGKINKKNKKNQITKKQHFVPKCLLSGFSFSEDMSDKWIWEYEKGTNKEPKKNQYLAFFGKSFTMKEMKLTIF